MTGFKSDLVLGEQISSGYFGKVFKATDPVHGAVAVKVLHKRADESDESWAVRKETLLGEAQLLSQGQHDNVVRVHYLVRHSADDTLHLVMSLCDGSLLNNFETGPMDLETVRKTATETLLGLHALHTRGMIHRDIKPGNLLIAKNGKTQLGDFGLVTNDIILGYGADAGYCDHLAPEVFEGRGTSVKTDIWALGMTLYRLMHGKIWYTSLPAPSDEIQKGGFASRLPWLPHVPDSWRRVIRKMMHDDSGQRYQTAMQALDALSTVSCDPNWACHVDTTKITWQRATTERSLFVEWTSLNAKKQTWRAVSLPLGSGNKRSLGGGTSTNKKCARELKNFFS